MSEKKIQTEGDFQEKKQALGFAFENNETHQAQGLKINFVSKD